MVNKTTLEEKPNLVVGQETQVPTLEGERKRYINLDNAATTPALKSVKQEVINYLNYYASIGRGTGFKSRVSTMAVKDAREVLSDFVGTDLESRTLIFTKHATEAINKVASRINFSEGDVVISTWMEHHANLLPWRKVEKEKGVNFVQSKINAETGRLNVEDLVEKIDKHKENLKLVAISGASNVTGYLPPIKEISRAVHRYGGYLLVDAAQLAPHRRIEVGGPSSSDRIDFLAYSGHKMYAPFGTGVLVGPQYFFENGQPERQGGGAVDLVSKDFTLWGNPPGKEETGTPNSVGIVAMATAAKTLMEKGMDQINEYEEKLTKYGIRKLSNISELTLYGPPDLSKSDRLGIFTFNLSRLHHNLVSSILSYEYGIATRSGCFCAHPYMLELLKIPEENINKSKKEVLRGVRANMVGAVRASLGIYNNKSDIDYLVSAIKEIISDKEKYKGSYSQDKHTGEFLPGEGLPNYRSYFAIDG